MIRRLLIMLGCLGAIQHVSAQGVVFERKGLEMALVKAARQKKLVMVDCYTTWCGPCKQVAGEVFPTREAGDYFNKTFVNCKMDMETVAGLRLHDKYGVYSYPTFLILDGDGHEVCRVAGGGSQASEMIARFEKALLPQNSWSAMRERYRQDTTFEQEYFDILQSRRHWREFARVLDERFVGQKDDIRFAAVNWSLYRDNTFDVLSPVVAYVMENQELVGSYLGDVKQAQSFVWNVVMASLRSMLTNGCDNTRAIAMLSRLFEQNEYLRRPTQLTYFKLIQAKEAGDYDTFVQVYQREVIRLQSVRRKDLDKALILLKDRFTKCQQREIGDYFKACREQEKGSSLVGYYDAVLEKW